MNRISKLRKDFKLTQNELANKLNITRSALSLYELGKRDPDTNTLKAIADFFDVSIDYLVGRTDIKTSPTSTDKISESVNDDPELSEFWNELKDREELKLLFKQTRELSPNDIKKIIKIIKAIEDEEDRNDG